MAHPRYFLPRIPCPNATVTHPATLANTLRSELLDLGRLPQVLTFLFFLLIIDIFVASCSRQYHEPLSDTWIRLRLLQTLLDLDPPAHRDPSTLRLWRFRHGVA
ncbi:hypothetical protein VTH06DRAFT_58 [Thermothelomyces fergusii]